MQIKAIPITLLIACFAFLLHSQIPDYGLRHSDPAAWDGYTLLAPAFSKKQYLLDMCGNVVHSWEGEFRNSTVAYLNPDGMLMRTVLNTNNLYRIEAGGQGERVQLVQWDGTVAWDFVYASDNFRMHHDVELMPNGNVLILAWEYKDSLECIASGRDPNTLGEGALWPEHLIEVRPIYPDSGEIVWAWHAWDHLVQDYDPTKKNYGPVADHPELLDINFRLHDGADWLHANSVDYNPELDQILFNPRDLNEFWILDHSTTTEEAASHRGGRYGKGGDILFRWGNPISYRAGDTADRQLWMHHDPHWIEPGLPGTGQIMVFNNGLGRTPVPYSSVDVIAPSTDAAGNYLVNPNGQFAPSGPAWTYQAPQAEDFYSRFISGAQRLPNGNTLVCSGMKARLFEVTLDKQIVWEYKNADIGSTVLANGDTVPLLAPNQIPRNIVFRAYRYAPDYPGLSGKVLAPRGPIELDPDPVSCNNEHLAEIEVSVYPNPATGHVNVDVLNTYTTVSVIDFTGRKLWESTAPGNHWDLDVSGWERGLYLVRYDKHKALRLLLVD